MRYTCEAKSIFKDVASLLLSLRVTLNLKFEFLFASLFWQFLALQLSEKIFQIMDQESSVKLPRLHEAGDYSTRKRYIPADRTYMRAREKKGSLSFFILAYSGGECFSAASGCLEVYVGRFGGGNLLTILPSGIQPSGRFM